MTFRSEVKRFPVANYLIQHAVQLVSGLAHTVAIIAVDHEDETLGVLEVVPPQRADLPHRRTLE